MADQDVADFLAAFEAGDKNKDGTLNTGEFIRLMVVLGVPGGADRARAVLRQINKNGDAVVTQQEYFQAIKQLSVPTTQIRQMKQIFDIFDHDQTGWASKKDVINGLGELGVPIEGELKENLEKLDANKDGKIWFPDFLRVQLNI
ncbi:uncharacterized protein LOC135463670 [Liolophura sinensis]|uniref:uncharacterized protein LOC135463670 n=1 Tax=Liolophura sinensis TaxID=3198878 RepID=UPI0031598777